MADYAERVASHAFAVASAMQEGRRADALAYRDAMAADLGKLLLSAQKEAPPKMAPCGVPWSMHTGDSCEIVPPAPAPVAPPEATAVGGNAERLIAMSRHRIERCETSPAPPEPQGREGGVPVEAVRVLVMVGNGQWNSGADRGEELRLALDAAEGWLASPALNRKEGEPDSGRDKRRVAALEKTNEYLRSTNGDLRAALTAARDELRAQQEGEHPEPQGREGEATYSVHKSTRTDWSWLVRRLVSTSTGGSHSTPFALARDEPEANEIAEGMRALNRKEGEPDGMGRLNCGQWARFDDALAALDHKAEDEGGDCSAANGCGLEQKLPAEVTLVPADGGGYWTVPVIGARVSHGLRGPRLIVLVNGTAGLRTMNGNGHNFVRLVGQIYAGALGESLNQDSGIHEAHVFDLDNGGSVRIWRRFKPPEEEKP